MTDDETRGRVALFVLCCVVESEMRVAAKC